MNQQKRNALKKRDYISSIWILMLLMIGPLQWAWAQGEMSPSDFESTNQSIPNSPGVAAIEQYNLVNVDLHTGTPSINIPLYTVSNRELSLPISLSYHASGVKVQEVASWVGLGWSLNAGGVISRRVVGLPDDAYEATWSDNGIQHLIPNAGYLYDQGFIHSLYPHPVSSWAYSTIIGELRGNTKDSAPDIFNFSFAGYSGRFVFDRHGEMKLFSNQDLKIDYIKTQQTIEAFSPYVTSGYPVRGAITEFSILTPDGTKYIFAAPEVSMVYHREAHGLAIDECAPPENGSTTACLGAGAYAPGGTVYNGQLAYTAWHLTKIIAVKGEETATIDLTYEDEFVLTDNITKQVNNLSRSDVDFCQYFEMNSGPVVQTTRFNPRTESDFAIHRKKRITAIDWAYGAIDFYANVDREDLYYYPGSEPLPRSKGLRIIRIRNQAEEILKSFHFTYSYFNKTGLSCTDPPAWMEAHRNRLRLDQLTEHGGGNVLPPYEFTYDAQALPPRHSPQQDYWGYYNGNGANQLIPSVYAYPEDDNTYYRSVYSIYPRTTYNGSEYYFPGADRSPDEQLMQAGVLKQIDYPTGGHTRFEYEAHRHRYNTNRLAFGFGEFIGGGLRVKRIIDHNGMNAANDLIKEYAYTYQVNGNCSGKLVNAIDFARFKSLSIDISGNPVDPTGDPTAATLLSSGATCSSGSRIIYEEVQEILPQNGKTVYTYDVPMVYSEGDLVDEPLAGGG
ncbi:MAG: hypothetical protein AAGD05_10520, partial [Bacteroidota bacterium]